MNLLVTSAGRRVKIIEYLKKALRKIDGKVIAVDCDHRAPALYFADEFEIVPRINDENYIQILIEICNKYDIKGIISLIDPELEILAKNEQIFDEKEIKLILSPLKMVQICFDKQETFNYLQKLSIPAVPTFDNMNDVMKLIKNKEFEFPFVVKPRKGSASQGLFIAKNVKELEMAFNSTDNMIIQPFFKDKEFGIDVYIDMNEVHLVDMFIKEKLSMRAGETDKSISVHNKKIETLIIDFIEKTDFIGPIDIDCFEYDGRYYISEINPRFGGGYPHAYEMGINFMEYILTNIMGESNSKYQGLNYESDFMMMKYDNVKILKRQIRKL